MMLRWVKTLIRRWRLSNAMDARSVARPAGRRARSSRDSFVRVHSALSDRQDLPWADPGLAAGRRAVRTISHKRLRQHSYIGFGHMIAASMALAGCLTAWNAYETHFRRPVSTPALTHAASIETHALVDSPLATQARMLDADTRKAAEIMTSRMPGDWQDIDDEPR